MQLQRDRCRGNELLARPRQLHEGAHTAACPAPGLAPAFSTRATSCCSCCARCCHALCCFSRCGGCKRQRSTSAGTVECCCRRRQVARSPQPIQVAYARARAHKHTYTHTHTHTNILVYYIQTETAYWCSAQSHRVWTLCGGSPQFFLIFFNFCFYEWLYIVSQFIILSRCIFKAIIYTVY